MNLGTVMPMLEPVVVVGEEFTEQATVSEWPARLASVALVAGLIALALWGIATGLAGQGGTTCLYGLNRRLRCLRVVRCSRPVSGNVDLGDWLDRVAVHELGGQESSLVPPRRRWCRHPA